MNFENRFDATGMEWIEGLRNGFVTEILLAYTSIGSVPVGLVMLLFIYYLNSAVFATLSVAVISNIFIVQGLKTVSSRERPPNQICRASFSSSFPSGHSSNSFLFATVLSNFYPGIAGAFFFFAVLVAFSRVYLREHYPTDVLVGAAIGTIIGLAAIAFI